MIFAETTQTATSTNLFNIVSVLFTVLGALAFIAAYFYVTLKKGERDYDKDTIRSLTENNTALRNELTAVKRERDQLIGEKTAWQKDITAAPEIEKLTKQMAKEHKDAMAAYRKILTALSKIIGEQSK
jgi:hypothetical protein